jgi:glycerol-3-phosphate acyltransferase PlsY
VQAFRAEHALRAASSFAAVALGYAAGAVPFSQVGAGRRGVDLRRIGTGTVSGTGLYRVAGPRALVGYGVLEVAKGAVGPGLALVAGHDRRGGTVAVAAGAAVVGHNWSPLLRGAGGRGVAPAMGALAVAAPTGALVLIAGLAAGRALGESAIGCAVADLALLPVLRRTGGPPAVRAGAAVLAPIVVKRLVGNGPAALASPGIYLTRLLVDRDTWAKP